MKVDLYLHSKYSYNSFSEPLKIVKVPKRKGLYYMKTEAFRGFSDKEKWKNIA